MAFSGAMNERNGRRRFSSPGALSEMNVVPLVDVVLVLLIIFMLTANVMEFGLQINVPAIQQTRDSAQDLPVINISRTGNLYLGERPININQIGEEVARQYKGAKEVYVRADRRGLIETFVQVVSALNQAHLGIKVVAKSEDLRVK
jgi:biopolymer transport protein ExbD